MQLYALNAEKQLVSAHQAAKQINYFCLECYSLVRLRSGIHRQSHFYHLQPTIFCRQHQKGLIHLHVQNYLIGQLSPEEATLECRFPMIKRIADVAWHSKKIIFEIQCSSISADEVKQRNADYGQLGWQVIWVLHDKRYNQKRLSAAEMTLQELPHFYTNMNQEGKGVIYDQFEICLKGLRFKKLAPLQIQPKKIHLLKEELFSTLQFYQERRLWPYYFEGDLIHLELSDPQALYLQEALANKKNYLPLSLSSLQKLRNRLSQGINTFWHLFLERMCR